MVANTTTETAVPVKYRRTLAHIKGYSVTVASGATVTINLFDSADRSLLAVIMDAEAHTTKTIYTSTALTASTDLPTTNPTRLTLIDAQRNFAAGETLWGSASTGTITIRGFWTRR
jgi:hypothetical protein